MVRLTAAMVVVRVVRVNVNDCFFLSRLLSPADVIEPALNAFLSGFGSRPLVTATSRDVTSDEEEEEVEMVLEVESCWCRLLEFKVEAEFEVERILADFRFCR